MGKQVNTTTDIIDIDLSAIRKKRFRIDGDDNRIIELNTSDLSILPRLKETYPKLMELNKRVSEMSESTPESDDTDGVEDSRFDNVIDTLTKVDKSMRELIDYIFDSNVSEVCAPSGSMYDPINGQCRFEHIISCLTNLYETDMSAELDKLSQRTDKYTSKYTKRKK